MENETQTTTADPAASDITTRLIRAAALALASEWSLGSSMERALAAIDTASAD
jgi:hypothetical protein